MEVDIATFVLRLEDRRERDPVIFGVASRSPAPAVRRLAALALGRTNGPESPAMLRLLLADGDSSVSASSAFMLGEMRDSLAAPALGALLSPAAVSGRPTVAREAAAALGRIATREARSLLSQFLVGGGAVEAAGSDDPLVRRVVAEALVAIRRAGETDISAWAGWTIDPDPEIRWSAVWALAGVRSPQVTSALLPLVTDSDAAVRAAAVQGLAALLSTATSTSPLQIRDQLIDLATTEESGLIRVEALRALRAFPDGVATRFLLERATGAPPQEAAIAIESLSAAAGDASAPVVPALLQLAEDPEVPDYLRGLAVETVGALAIRNSTLWLPRAATDPSWRVRAAAVRVAARNSAETASILDALLHDPDPRVVTTGVDALINAVAPEELRASRFLLLELLQAPDIHLRASVLRGLALLGDPVLYPALLDAYDRARYDRENAAALAAVEAIARLRRAGSITPERAFFTRFQRSDDPAIRRRVADLFPEASRSAWGDPRPVETYWIDARYRDYVTRWISPDTLPEPLPRVRIETTLGPVEAVLSADLAPRTVTNFLDLASAGFFDNQEWAQVVPGLTLSGGDPRGDSGGGPGYTIRDEVNRLRFEAGTLGMVLDGPDTGGSRFFVTHSPQPLFDGVYTAFGEVVSGMDLIEQLLPGDRILSVREITEGF
jgi:cyclophilin family peptidyl-prolyl cis-trans isomerase/HEAT repeat protein